MGFEVHKITPVNWPFFLFDAPLAPNQVCGKYDDSFSHAKVACLVFLALWQILVRTQISYCNFRDAGILSWQQGAHLHKQTPLKCPTSGCAPG